MNLHTILGAGGTVSNQLLPVLLANKEKVRLVSRKAIPVPGAEVKAADVTRYPEVLDAVRGSSVVYLLVGLQYDIRVWKVSWPLIMTNVINACKETGCKLIFFDNVYMYGLVDGKMTETTAFNPCSKKGEVRAAIASQLLQEMKAGNLQALIARAADFYGPVGYQVSIANMLVFRNLKAGKKAQWIINAQVPHSFTYVPDAAKALYMLSSREDAFGQTWHLPTAPDPLTGAAFIELAESYMQIQKGFMVIPKWMISLLGLFIRPMKESVEMAYQNAYPYVFDSTKFNSAFGYSPLNYREGIRDTAIWALNQ